MATSAISINKDSIRTMRKDLRQLRQADALGSRRPMALGTKEAPPVPSGAPLVAKKLTPPPASLFTAEDASRVPAPLDKNPKPPAASLASPEKTARPTTAKTLHIQEPSAPPSIPASPAAPVHVIPVAAPPKTQSIKPKNPPAPPPQNILASPSPAPKPAPPMPLTSSPRPTPAPPPGSLEKVLMQEKAREQVAISHARQYANEAEKQEIFSMEEQKKELERELDELSKKEEPPLDLEKNRILLAEKRWQKKLNPLAKQEEGFQAQEDVIEEKERTTHVPSERHTLEKERWSVEDRRQKVEKRRWQVEQQLEKLRQEMQEIDKEYRSIGERESSLKAKVAQIDERLKNQYAGIAGRENERRSVSQPPAKAQLPPVKSAPAISPRPAPPAFTRSIPEAEKQKLAQSAATEEVQRKKFMEDVEAWANSDREN